MTFLIRAIGSTAVILIVTWIGRRSPGLGGLIAALPFVSVLSAIWLRNQGQARLDEFFVGVLIGLLPTALLLGGTALALRVTGNLFGALAVGTLLWVPCALVAQRLLP